MLRRNYLCFAKKADKYGTMMMKLVIKKMYPSPLVTCDMEKIRW